MAHAFTTAELQKVGLLSLHCALADVITSEQLMSCSKNIELLALSALRHLLAVMQ